VQNFGFHCTDYEEWSSAMLLWIEKPRKSEPFFGLLDPQSESMIIRNVGYYLLLETESSQKT